MIKKIVWPVLFLFVFAFYSPLLAQTADPAGGDEYHVADTIIEAEYQLGPGDQVAVNIIVGDNDMSIDNLFTIGPDGKIFFPKVGELNLLGLSIPEAKDLIDSRVKTVYREKYSLSFRLVQPRRVQIYLSGSEDKPLYIGEKKYVSIYGEVTRAGRYEYIPDKKLSDYISYAGGPTQRADLAGLTVTRGTKKIPINGSDVLYNGKVDKDIVIMPGDVVHVPGQFFYFTDFGSFSNMILTFVALYNTFVVIR